MIRKVKSPYDDEYLLLRTGKGNLVKPGTVDINCVYELVTLDRPKARELAAILTHFADNGELPGEACDAD